MQVYDKSNGGCTYYVNCRTGQTSWEKPVEVGRSELPEPVYRWYRMSHQFEGAT